MVVANKQPHESASHYTPGRFKKWRSHVRVPLEPLNDAESFPDVISDLSRQPAAHSAPNSREVRSI